MPKLLDRKAGIVACSGEELAEGTVARLAALKVLHELRPQDTVTICLPLFLAGDQGDRAFARDHPTITVDGCALRCAGRATEKYSGKPAASIVVSELVAECGLGKPEGRRCLNEAGRQVVDATAERLAALVDQVLGKKGSAGGSVTAKHPDMAQATCSCGSGIAVALLTVNGTAVECVALPLILKQFQDAGQPPDEAVADEIMATVKVYNAVPPEAETAYREAVLREYSHFCQQERVG